MKQKILFITISIIAIMACCPALLPAWFSEAREVTQPFCYPPSGVSDDPALFYVYDNVVSGENRADAPYLMPSTRNFVPADRISINMPLQTLSGRSASSSESLDALLNANLSLQLLMEQYRALQKRTAELLKSLNIPYLEQLKNRTINNMDISLNKGKQRREPEVQNPNIRLQAAELSHQISETVRNKPADTFYLSDKEIPSFSGLKVEREVEVVGGKKLFSVADAKLEIISGGGTAVQGGDGSGFSATSEEGQFESESSDRTSTSQVSLNGSSGQTELPWIFRVVLSSAGYVAANKVESLFYGAILFSILYFIYLKVGS